MCNLSAGIIEKTRQESKLETLCSGVKNIMESLKMTVDDAMKVLKISKEDQVILRKMLCIQTVNRRSSESEILSNKEW